MSNKTREEMKNEQLSRAIEVLNIWGEKLPEDFDINEKSLQPVKLQNSNSEISIGSDGDIIKIIFEKDKYRCYWYSVLCEDGTISEEFDVDYGSVTAVFFHTQEASLTSGFYLYNNVWGSPKIYADIDSVSIGAGNQKQVFPIDDYYDVFVSYMKSKKTNIDHAVADDPDVIDKIIELFGKPIKDHVSDLKNNDQNWRFENERKKILSYYDDEVNKANQTYSQSIKEAEDRLSSSLQSAENYKETGIKTLDALQNKYVKKHIHNN